MDVLLLGALAVVLIAITVWIVMWPSRAPAEAAAAAAASSEDAAELTPQGDRFEDQYTSATADLSAGAVATTLANEAREEAAPVSVGPPATAFQTQSELWSSPALAREGQPTAVLAAETARPKQRSATVGLGAAALLTLGGAIGGALLYARWQRERNKPVSRIKRRLIK